MKRSFFSQLFLALPLVIGCHRSLQVGETIYIYPDAGPDALGADVSVDGPMNFDAPPDGQPSHQFGPLIVGEERPLNDSSDPGGTFVFGEANSYVTSDANEAAVRLRYSAAAELGNSRLVIWVQQAQGRDTLWALRNNGETSERWLLDARPSGDWWPEVLVADGRFLVVWQHDDGRTYLQQIATGGDVMVDAQLISAETYARRSNAIWFRGGVYFADDRGFGGSRPASSEVPPWQDWRRIYRVPNAIRENGHLYGTDQLYFVHSDGINVTQLDSPGFPLELHLPEEWRQRLRAAYPMQGGFILALETGDGLVSAFGRLQNGQLTIEATSPLRWTYDEPLVFVEQNGRITLHPCDDSLCTKASTTELAVWNDGTLVSSCWRRTGSCRLPSRTWRPSTEALIAGSANMTLGHQCEHVRDNRSECSIALFEGDQIELLVGPERSHVVPRLFGRGAEIWGAYYSNESELRVRPISAPDREFSLGSSRLLRVDDSQGVTTLGVVRDRSESTPQMAQLLTLDSETGPTVAQSTVNEPAQETWIPCGAHRLLSRGIGTAHEARLETVQSSDGRQLSVNLGWGQQFIGSGDQCYFVQFTYQWSGQPYTALEFSGLDDRDGELTLTRLATSPTLAARYENDMVAIPNGLALLLPSTETSGGVHLVIFQTSGVPAVRSIPLDFNVLYGVSGITSASLARRAVSNITQHIACDGQSLLLIQRQRDQIEMVRLDLYGNEVGRAGFTLSATPELESLSSWQAPIGWQAVHGTEPGRFVIAYQQFSREHQAYRIYLRDITALDTVIR